MFSNTKVVPHMFTAVCCFQTPYILNVNRLPGACACLHSFCSDIPVCRLRRHYYYLLIESDAPLPQFEANNEACRKEQRFQFVVEQGTINIRRGSYSNYMHRQWKDISSWQFRNLHYQSLLFKWILPFEYYGTWSKLNLLDDIYIHVIVNNKLNCWFQ